MPMPIEPLVPGQTIPEKGVLIVVDPDAYGHTVYGETWRTFVTDEAGLADRIDYAEAFAVENGISKLFIDRKR